MWAYLGAVKVVQLCPTLWSHGLYPAKLLCPWNSPGQETGVGSRSLLQGIFPTQGLNPGLLHCRRTFHHPEPPEKPRGHLWEIIILPALRSLYEICSVWGWVYKIHDISRVWSLACTFWSFLTSKTLKKIFLGSCYKAVVNHKWYFHTIIFKLFELHKTVS